MSKDVSNKKLIKKSKALEDEVLQLRQLATILIDRTDWYQIIFNTCPFGIVIIDLDFRLQDANSAFLEMLNYQSVEELKDANIQGLIPEEHRCNETEKAKIVDALYCEGISNLDSNLQILNGPIIPVNLTACVAKNKKGNPLKVAVFVENRTVRIQSKNLLNQKDLEIQKLEQNLEEQKNFHKIILEQARKNQKDMEESIVLNIKTTVFPYLGKLQHTTELTDYQIEYLDLVKSQLLEVISPFYSELSSRHSDLTPTELRIAGLVRDGKTTKDIAKLLNLSAGTVEFHRNNLRKKLRIRNTNINLRSHLLSLD